MVCADTIVTEDACLFGSTQPLVGVVSRPATAADPARPAVLLSNSGMVHRVGPAGTYVHIARELAAHGHVVARIDHGGIGDSVARADHRPYPDSAVAEMREVMDDLSSSYGVERFVILGLCSGAEIALQTARADARVRGAVMINGGGQFVSGELNQYVLNKSWASDYWRRSAFRPSAWWRAVTGRIQYRHLARVLGRQIKGLFGPSPEAASAAASFGEEIHGLADRGVHLLWVYSEGDHAMRLQKVMLGPHLEALEESGRFEVEVIADTDHTFTFLRNQRALLTVINDWAARSFG